MINLKLVKAAAFAGLTLAPSALFAESFVTIGTGGVTGVYYPTGGAICRLVNQGRKEHGIRCSVESTGGSVYNINTIREGELEFGVAQSDWEFHAYHGSSKFEDAGAFADLRSVFSIHAEPFSVLARTDSEVSVLEDLKGKRVNVGNPGSGARGTTEVVMDALGWQISDFKLATELKSAEQAAALCDNQIDVMVHTTGHPSGMFKEATTACDAQLVEVAGAEIDRLVSEHPYYRTATIPAGMYRGTDRDIATFGVGANFVTSTAVSEEAVYAIVSAVFNNIESFKKLHPAFANLDPKTMATAGLSAPLHPGAAKYYREQGWIE